jgi:hypothetical protein
METRCTDALKCTPEVGFHFLPRSSASHFALTESFRAENALPERLASKTSPIKLAIN